MNRQPKTVMEKRAHEWCDDLKQSGSAHFTIEWVKSRIWGRCARIMDHWNRKMAHAGGCGYDKESAVLAELLCWLDDKISGCSGAGVSTVQQKCKSAGWHLEKVAWTKDTNTYVIRRIDASNK